MGNIVAQVAEVALRTSRTGSSLFRSRIRDQLTPVQPAPVQPNAVAAIGRSCTVQPRNPIVGQLQGPPYMLYRLGRNRAPAADVVSDQLPRAAIAAGAESLDQLGIGDPLGHQGLGHFECEQAGRIDVALPATARDRECRAIRSKGLESVMRTPLRADDGCVQATTFGGLRRLESKATARR
jgi:hypothetical protein